MREGRNEGESEKLIRLVKIQLLYMLWEVEMVKHVILWTLKEDYSGAEMDVIREGIKSGLEGLKGQIPGLIDIKVYIDPLGSSNCDLMLDSTFKDEAALKEYANHPAHVEVANTKVRPFTSGRVCMDFEI